METKKCPRCGEDMTFNPLIMDYVCDNCQMMSMEAFERVCQGDWLSGFGKRSEEQSKHRMMDTVDDEF